jgi:hypothetical protein
MNMAIIVNNGKPISLPLLTPPIRSPRLRANLEPLP